MIIGVPREVDPEQTLVSATPDTVAKLIKLGYEVRVESGAGMKASYFDEQYVEAGATLTDKQGAWGADIVTCYNPPTEEEMALIRRGATLIGSLNPGGSPELVEKFQQMGITALALDAVPRLSRAQSMDIRSSMANIGGYRAVIEAANAFGRLFTGQVTAAGKVPPAKVYIIGVGVAGLAAIGTAKSMGAVVSATDVRAEVADQVESLGGTFVEIPVKQESTDGYAKEMTSDQQDMALKVYTEQAAINDIIITTAQIPGRPAPLLITAEAVAGMKPGSVIVDMGSTSGGNCELTVPGEVITTDNGVTIIGHTNLPSRLPGQASQLYGQNIVNFLKLATPGKDGELVLDEEDEVVRGITATLDGELMWPPPPVSVSAAPPAKKAAEPEIQEGPAEELPAWRRWWWKIAGVALGVALVLAAPAEMAGHFVVFELAVVVGFYVITNVTHTLHTPLMSETNAISGIIIVGALLLIGSSNPVVAALSFVACLIASINIFGGFLVTHRMLKMFERSSGDK